jgi:protein TonB
LAIPDDQIYDPHQDGVTAPKATFTPEPEFPEEARRARFQEELKLSIVVDKAGNVARIRVDEVLGHGLDEQSTKAVKV